MTLRHPQPIRALIGSTGKRDMLFHSTGMV